MSESSIARVQDSEAFCSSVDADVWHAQTGEKAFEWWYFDALSDDGREAVVITFSDNYVFSPRYASVVEPMDDSRERFPAVAFTYLRDGSTVFRTVNEYPVRQFQASRNSAKCSIGKSSFHVDAASYGTGYLVNVEMQLSPSRRLKAVFEWLSIESDLMPEVDSSEAYRSHWNVVAARSDVAGRIELIDRQDQTLKLFHFRGTGYHDHFNSDTPIYDSIGCRQWGRAHFSDTTAVYCLQKSPNSDAETARLFIVRDGKINERPAAVESQRFRRDRFGIKYPTRVSILTEDSIRLRIKPLSVFDSNFYFVRSLAEMTLVLRDGKPRKTTGITEHLAPKNIKYRLFRWFSDLKIGRDGKGPVF